MSLALSTSPKFRAPAKLFHAAPWLRHLFSHTVAAQDVAILHKQARTSDCQVLCHVLCHCGKHARCPRPRPVPASAPAALAHPL